MKAIDTIWLPFVVSLESVFQEMFQIGFYNSMCLNLLNYVLLIFYIIYDVYEKLISLRVVFPAYIYNADSSSFYVVMVGSEGSMSSKVLE